MLCDAHREVQFDVYSACELYACYCNCSMQATRFVHAKQYACFLLAESYFALSYGMYLFVMLEGYRVTGWTVVARQYLFLRNPVLFCFVLCS